MRWCWFWGVKRKSVCWKFQWGEFRAFEVHRFENTPVRINQSLFWDFCTCLTTWKLGFTKLKTIWRTSQYWDWHLGSWLWTCWQKRWLTFKSLSLQGFEDEKRNWRGIENSFAWQNLWDNRHSVYEFQHNLSALHRLQNTAGYNENVDSLLFMPDLLHIFWQVLK